jgi:hypothetical protein
MPTGSFFEQDYSFISILIVKVYQDALLLLYQVQPIIFHYLM